MALRTTPTLVIEVMKPGQDYDEEDSPPLTIFMLSANKLTDAWITAIARYRPELSSPDTETRQLMETWLSAFFFKLSDQQYKTKNSGKASASFRGVEGRGLELNMYGVGALGIDAPYLVLKPLYEGRIASTQWLGKVPSEQIPYDERN